VQRPHPPVILGGSGPNVLKRVVAYGDGWMPNRGEVIGRMPELKTMAEAAGRGNIPVTVYPKADASELEQFALAGVDRCIFYVPPDGRDQALARLDELTRLVAPFA